MIVKSPKLSAAEKENTKKIFFFIKGNIIKKKFFHLIENEV